MERGGGGIGKVEAEEVEGEKNADVADSAGLRTQFPPLAPPPADEPAEETESDRDR